MAIRYSDVIMGAMASQITSLTIVYSIVYSDANLRKHQSSASLAFMWGIHRWPANSPHKWPVTRKMFPFHDVIMDGCPSYIFLPWPIDSRAIRKWETNKMLWCWHCNNLGELDQFHGCWCTSSSFAKTSAAMVLTMLDQWVLILNREWFQVPVPTLCYGIVGSTDFCCLQQIQHHKDYSHRTLCHKLKDLYRLVCSMRHMGTISIGYGILSIFWWVSVRTNWALGTHYNNLAILRRTLCIDNVT